MGFRFGPPASLVTCHTWFLGPYKHLTYVTYKYKKNYLRYKNQFFILKNLSQSCQRFKMKNADTRKVFGWTTTPGVLVGILIQIFSMDTIETMDMVACVMCTFMIVMNAITCPVCGSRQPRRKRKPQTHDHVLECGENSVKNNRKKRQRRKKKHRRAIYKRRAIKATQCVNHKVS